MAMNRKMRDIEIDLDRIEGRLANAREYLARRINIESSGWLHLNDWRGKSGHPLWIKNFMVPTVLRRRAKKEKTLRDLANKEKDKSVTMRKLCRDRST